MDKFDIRPAETIEDVGLCMTVYGKPGVGKSKLALQASKLPACCPVLLLDIEAGKLAAQGMKGVNYLPITKASTFEDFVSRLFDIKEVPYQTIIVDNMSELLNLCIAAASGGKKVEIQHYGEATNQMLRYTRKLRDYAQTKNIVVLLIAWDSPEKDENSGLVTRLDIGFTPSLAKQFPGLVDIVGHLQVLGDPDLTRELSFAANPKSAAKLRRNESNTSKEIPLSLYYKVNETPLVDLIQTLKLGQPFPKDKYQRTRPRPQTP